MFQPTFGSIVSSQAPSSPVSHSPIDLRMPSTFSSDISYSDSPAASRASLWLIWSFT